MIFPTPVALDTWPQVLRKSRRVSILGDFLPRCGIRELKILSQEWLQWENTESKLEEKVKARLDPLRSRTKVETLSDQGTDVLARSERFKGIGGEGLINGPSRPVSNTVPFWVLAKSRMLHREMSGWSTMKIRKWSGYWLKSSVANL